MLWVRRDDEKSRIWFQGSSLDEIDLKRVRNEAMGTELGRRAGADIETDK